jgi:hypothetical protein
MCIFGQGKQQGQSITAAPVPPAPMRADEENKAAVNESLEEIRRRRGIASTNVTGGLGDSSFGSSVSKPSVTALGQG